jgi:hypothetical protein
MTATMVQTSIRQEISGVIVHIDYYAGGYLKILSVDGRRYSVHQNRIVNSPGGHRCVCRVGDEITFRINPEGAVCEVRFAHPPEVELAEEERSIVTVISGDLIFGERVQPNCGCPLLLGTHHKFPSLAVGMQVHHTLGVYNNKPMGTNLRINWNYGGTQ